MQSWTSTLTERLSLPPRIFQAGGFAEDPTSSAPITTVKAIDEGIDSTGVIKLFDQHTYVPVSIEFPLIKTHNRYQYSTCDPKRDAIATLPNLINHQNITVNSLINYLAFTCCL